MNLGKSLALLFVIPLGAAVLGGCGSSSGSSGDPVASGPFGNDPNGIAFVGAASCIDCHQDLGFSVQIVQNFLGSRHVIHEDHINAASPATCLQCHDPIRDGRTLEGLLAAASVPAQGLAAVTCEDCHGAGGRHFGVGPINAAPDFTACGKCHRALPPQPDDPADHLPVFGDNILANYQSGSHADSFSGKLTPGTQDMLALCARCHTDQGYRALVQFDGGLAALQAALDPLPPVSAVSVVQCRTCHDPHTGNLRAQPAAADGTSPPPAGTPQAFSAQFNLCTSCHQVFLTADLDAVTGTFTYALDVAIYQNANVAQLAEIHNPATGQFLNTEPGADPGDRTITDTHFAGVDGLGNAVTGYNINAADESACSLCHDPHGATRFTQAAAVALTRAWGSTGHANYAGEPFTHDFTDNTCLKCHSGTEYVKFVRGAPQAALDLAGGARVIGCVACHDLTARNAAGAFALGAVRPVGSVAFPSGAVRTLGFDGSHLCMGCHQGRESGVTVANAVAGADTHPFINRHYSAAAAILLGSEVTAGFQYPGRNYRTRNGFTAPQMIGLRTCVECHLRSAQGVQDHTFRPLTADCQQCHVDAGTVFPGTLTSFDNLGLPFGAFASTDIDYDGDGIGESFQGEIDGFAGDGVNKPAGALLTAIQGYAAATLQQPVAYMPGVYPYWFRDLDADGIADPGEATFANGFAAFDDRLLQAAFNFHSAQDPCGKIHNHKYVLQTLYDALDDLDDGLQNSSVQFNAAPATRAFNF